MTIDQIIALAASVGSCFAAVATFLTVAQIAKQRKAAYRPEIAPSRTQIEGTVGSFEKGAQQISLRTVDSEGAVVDKNNTSNGLAIPIANIGLGSAKDIVITWDFPISELVEELNKRAQRTFTPAYFTFENGILSAKSDATNQWSSMWDNQQKDSLDYVLSAAIQRDPTMLVVPHAYISSVSALIALAIKEEATSFPEIPKLKLRFDYRDIGDESHFSNFSAELHIFAILNKGETIHGYLEFRKIKP
jgi:hypothetical protein